MWATALRLISFFFFFLMISKDTIEDANSAHFSANIIVLNRFKLSFPRALYSCRDGPDARYCE